jgi:hypothetical protein
VVYVFVFATMLKPLSGENRENHEEQNISNTESARGGLSLLVKMTGTPLNHQRN